MLKVIINKYSNGRYQEMTDMYLMYGLVERNSAKTKLLCGSFS